MAIKYFVCNNDVRYKKREKEANPELKSRMQELKQEAKELKNILSTIIDNTIKRNKIQETNIKKDTITK